LENIFNLSDVCWDEIWINSQKSILVEVCNYWSTKDINCTVSFVAYEFGLSTSTIRNYLKSGTKLGLCEYNSKEGYIAIKLSHFEIKTGEPD
jgi:hypothetical protein